jgi:putative hydrolase
VELIRRASEKGYRGIALTDHVGIGSLERLIREIVEDCRIARELWGIAAIPGVELTHLPAQAVAQAAKRAKELGAWIVVVHGETVVEPVEKGTNLAAVRSPDVDILAHPGLITVEEARLAASNGVFIEVSARKGHSLTNGHVVKTALAAGCKMLLDSDAHDSPDLLSPELATAILLGSGLGEKESKEVLAANPTILLKKLPLTTSR